MSPHCPRSWCRDSQCVRCLGAAPSSEKKTLLWGVWGAVTLLVCPTTEQVTSLYVFNTIWSQVVRATHASGIFALSLAILLSLFLPSLSLQHFPWLVLSNPPSLLTHSLGRAKIITAVLSTSHSCTICSTFHSWGSPVDKLADQGHLFSVNPI